MTPVLLLGIVGAALLIAAVAAVLVLEGLDAGRSPDSVTTRGPIPRRRRVMTVSTAVLVVVSVAYAGYRIALLAG